MQDTLARAWEKRRLWEAGTDLRAWLFTVMHNLHINQLATIRRDAATLSLDERFVRRGMAGLRCGPTSRSAVLLQEVMRQMERLPADQREVLVLAAVEELRYEEIAAVLSVPIGTVMSRLSRAREKLRRLVAEPASPLRIIK